MEANEKMFKKICSAILLLSFLALAGCPEMAQRGDSSSSDESMSGGGE
jgi:hypothetical protein